MFRHVVMFRWRADSTEAQRAASIAALRAFAAAMTDFGTVTVGVDAGLADGNFDAVVVADFSDPDDYLAYSADPRHRDLVTMAIAPILDTRVAVQCPIEPM